MSKLMIDVQNVSKKFELGEVASGSFRETLTNFFSFKKAEKEEFWALQDISFQVNQGDVVGIVGRNGAGKSTLLKVLSKITEPTSGRIMLNGRVASLLEVGTGFHPELTGRENVFLNGSILGMTRSEIRQKFDEIVDFSGVEKFLDTPVKRYSSGMYVRLAFAVAAHLEPEILVIDEVLAVGDAEFQKKCLGKMGQVAQGGRTVLFVSHNMIAVKTLCNKGVFLNKGKVEYVSDDIQKVVTSYLDNNRDQSKSKVLLDLDAKGMCKVESLEILNLSDSDNLSLTMKDSIGLKVNIDKITDVSRIDITLQIKEQNGAILFPTTSFLSISDNNATRTGKMSYMCKIPGNFFNEGRFYINLSVVENGKVPLLHEPDVCSFMVNVSHIAGSNLRKKVGIIYPKDIVRWTEKF